MVANYFFPKITFMPVAIFSGGLSTTRTTNTIFVLSRDVIAAGGITIFFALFVSHLVIAFERN